VQLTPNYYFIIWNYYEDLDVCKRRELRKMKIDWLIDLDFWSNDMLSFLKLFLKNLIWTLVIKTALIRIPKMCSFVRGKPFCFEMSLWYLPLMSLQLWLSCPQNAAQIWLAQKLLYIIWIYKTCFMSFQINIVHTLSWFQKYKFCVWENSMVFLILERHQ
jgi:hypothetical protein